MTLTSIAEKLWSIPSSPGDADALNRGQVVNLLLVQDGTRLWLVGSGPSPAFARRVDCTVQRQLGRRITDVVSPWARSELVLGASGLPQATHWAHADVARAMRLRCPHCVQRLSSRLGTAASDLGPHPVRPPDRRLHGDEGTLGPMTWWRVQREPGTSVTLFHPRGSKVLTAHGLIWTPGAPDLRDSSMTAMTAAVKRLASIAGNLPGAPDLLPEQGPLGEAQALLAKHVTYWQALHAAVRRGMDAGHPGTLPVDSLPGVNEAMTRSAQHALNWQRAWREVEAEDAPLPPLRPGTQRHGPAR